MNVHVGMLYIHASQLGEAGLAYRAWISVVFLLIAGIAKPLKSVRNK